MIVKNGWAARGDLWMPVHARARQQTKENYRDVKKAEVVCCAYCMGIVSRVLTENGRVIVSIC